MQWIGGIVGIGSFEEGTRRERVGTALIRQTERVASNVQITAASWMRVGFRLHRYLLYKWHPWAMGGGWKIKLISLGMLEVNPISLLTTQRVTKPRERSAGLKLVAWVFRQTLDRILSSCVGLERGRAGRLPAWKFIIDSEIVSMFSLNRCCAVDRAFHIF